MAGVLKDNINLSRDVVETPYDRAKFMFDMRKSNSDMTCQEANDILKYTTIYIYQYNGKFKWFGIMAEYEGFDTPMEALEDALDYLKRGGY